MCELHAPIASSKESNPAGNRAYVSQATNSGLSSRSSSVSCHRRFVTKRSSRQIAARVASINTGRKSHGGGVHNIPFFAESGSAVVSAFFVRPFGFSKSLSPPALTSGGAKRRTLIWKNRRHLMVELLNGSIATIQTTGERMLLI